MEPEHRTSAPTSKMYFLIRARMPDTTRLTDYRYSPCPGLVFDRARLRRGVRLLARVLLVLGATGILLQLELLPKLARSLLGWGAWLAAGGPLAGLPQTAQASPLDEPLPRSIAP